MSDWNAWKDYTPDPATVLRDTSKPGTRQKPATARTTAEPLSAYPRGGIVASSPVSGIVGGDGATARDCPTIYLAVTPCPKPRMTQRDKRRKNDKWPVRPCVMRYRAFCDAVLECWPAGVPYPAEGAHITFHLAMPKSWSRAKRDAYRGQAHQSKPDKDNLEKAIQDALCKNDAHVWDSRTTKRWADVGYISITINE